MADASAGGYYWSASQSAINALYSSILHIHSGNVIPVNNTFRASGLSVRCVAEL
ncbi:MAG: hypothetical protein LUF87_03905 [Alistipes sp.]|nr:hypothetical protein [Alistipes sp.]